ncbi:MAG: hypothetical protein IPN70_05345 [Candidatus Moraniibacteriota bacterium]|nr:MAG: hypothetical protein IPN70_05345 [Candidatus Moranbacteria bacterium]
MATFFINSKNIFTAVIRENHIPLYKEIRKSGGCPPLGGAKIFVFYKKEMGIFSDIFSNIPPVKDLYRNCAGTIDDFHWLIQKGQHRYTQEYRFTGWDGFIPFCDENLFCNEKEEYYLTNLSDIRKIFFST